MATFIPTSPNSPLYRETVNRFWRDWRGDHTKPTIVNVFYVNHKRHQVWYNYEAYKKRKGNERYMYHGTTRACTIGDDNLQIYPCQLPNCTMCKILRATVDPSAAKNSGMFGIGAYVAPNSSKSANPRLYLKNADPSTSRNLVLLRCAVSLGRTFRAKYAMKGRKAAPRGYDSISGVGGVTKYHRGGRRRLRYDETCLFTKDAILPIEAIVLRFPRRSSRPHNTYVSPYTNYTRMLLNVRELNWSVYPEVIRGTRYGDVLWTDGNDGYHLASAPNQRAYKVVRRNPLYSPNGAVVAEGYASANPFYFQLQ